MAALKGDISFRYLKQFFLVDIGIVTDSQCRIFSFSFYYYFIFYIFVLAITGSVGGILVKHHGCRKVAILGSIIATVGLATSMFVPSMYFLYLTYGFVTGKMFISI